MDLQITLLYEEIFDSGNSIHIYKLLNHRIVVIECQNDGYYVYNSLKDLEKTNILYAANNNNDLDAWLLKMSSINQTLGVKLKNRTKEHHEPII